MNDKGIYVASKTKHASMWQDWRAHGYPIISTWIDEDDEGVDHYDLWLRICQEVAWSGKLVIYVEDDDFPLKGALVEVGMALATGVPICLVLSPSIKIDPTTLRPIGSWIKHPLVKQYDSIESALVA